MQSRLFDDMEDLSSKRVLVSLSGGINSAAVLCYLTSEYPKNRIPKNLFIFYSHLSEHSPDTFRFVKDCIRYAQKHYECVTWEIFRGSVLKFFREKSFIPHPILSPCSEHLKWIPAREFSQKHQIDVDLIGFIKTERNRISRQQKKGANGKVYPISHLNEDDCFELVDREIGWHPAIYDIKDAFGKRVFKHNNCLPCKNMTGALNGETVNGQYADVQLYYPEYFDRAKQLSDELNSYWGRKENFDGYCKTCEFD